MATTAKTKLPAPAAEKKPKDDGVRGFVAEWTSTILILVFATTLIAQVMAIPTSSMHNTLLTGDHLIVDKLAYSPPGPVSQYLLPYTQVKRGDIIVFRHPILLQENYVKRVIGIPGDHIHLVNKQLYLNGKAEQEPYAIHISPYISSYRDNFPNGGDLDYEADAAQAARARAMLRDDVKDGELVVPPGLYFAMGDNRDNSADSRYWGLVPRGNIMGKPTIILWSYDAPTADLQEYTVHHFVDLAEHFFTKTRWDRTFKVIHGYPLQ